jgi:CubicO group peptidase (beta-lactamase class C family)
MTSPTRFRSMHPAWRRSSLLTAQTFVLLSLLFCAERSFGQGELAALDRIFSHWNNSTPGVAVAVKRGDSVIYRMGYGLSDLEHNVPLTPEAVLESGSVAKQFTAMSILLLASEGKLSLTDDVRKYVPEVPSYGTVITLQMLLNHTSGLKDWGSIGGLSGWQRTTRVYTQQLALDITARQKSTNFTPGTEYSYSNTNYTLLVTIVERVSGMSLAEFTSQRIFAPLQMTSTRWRDNFRTIVKNRAIGYQASEGGYQQLMPFEDVHGHGGLLTTVDDLLKWNALLETHAIGGDKVFQERIRCGRLANGRAITYAAGLQIADYGGFREIAHSGATAGYRAWLAYYPEKRLSVVLLSNDATFSPMAVGRQVARVLLGVEPTKAGARPSVRPDADDLLKFKGDFRSTRHLAYRHFTAVNGSIYVDGKRADFISGDTLSEGTDRWVYQRNGRIQLIQYGDTLSFRAVGPARMNGDVAGTYLSDEVDASYHFYFDKDQLMLKMGHWPATPLQAVFRDAYADDDGVLYEFIRKKGRVLSVDVSVSRAEKMAFQKMK